MEKQEGLLQVHLERPVYEQEALNQDYNYERPRVSLLRKVGACCTPDSCKSCLVSVIPALSWLKKYKWKESIIPDIIAGLTVAVMHIPQGMAYALLGNVPPVVGIYMAFFPVLIYFFFGTSKHVSMGTFAVVCLMTGRTVMNYAMPHHEYGSVNATNEVYSMAHTNSYTPMQVATAVTLMVGIFQIVMYICRLGIISTLLSETLVNSFTTGAAVHVLLSQIKDLLGLKLAKQKGNFKLIFTLIDVFHEIPNTNLASLTVSAISIFILSCNNELLKPWVNKKCSMPIPIELIAVVTGTLVSKYFLLPETYGIQAVGHIPTGLPNPEVPPLELLHSVAVDCIAITMVSYTITISMALIFAQKLDYEINSNQELLAMGCSNIFGSFFSCMPVSASLSRSLIQQTVGGRTQIASVVSCLILLVILLWIGPFFEPLPRCVLASIIVVALKGMFLQASQLRKFWKLNKYDAIIWIVTFLTVVLINIDIGLLVGLLLSLAIVLFQSIRPYVCLLGHIPSTDLYLDLSRYKSAVEIPGLKIFHYCGTLNFTNCGNVKSTLYKLVDVDPQKVMKQRTKYLGKDMYVDPQDSDDQSDLRCVIMDMSAVSYIDPSSVSVLHSVMTDFSKIDVQFYLSNCPSHVFETIKKYDVYMYGKLRFKIFATIQDAITYEENEFHSR